LSAAEEFAPETGAQKTAPGAAGAVHDQNGVCDPPGGVARGRPEGGVMQAKFGQTLAGLESEIPGNPITRGLGLSDARENQK
jgi:hypothetical protein